MDPNVLLPSNPSGRRVKLLISLSIIVVLAGVFAASTIYFFHNTKKVTPKTASNTSSAIPQLSKALPSLHTELVLTNLDHPWDLAFLPDSSILYTERAGTLTLLAKNTSTVVFKPADITAQGEAGMMGLAIDNDYINNHFVYVCMASKQAGSNDVRVVRLKLTADASAVVERKDIVTGIPFSTGRHSGCRPRMGGDSRLWIGTGDSATANVPQNPKSLGGKVLRVDREGAAIAGNLTDPYDRRIYSYGHRNVQGIVLWPNGPTAGGSYGFSIEHGTGKDDEINELKAGNFGWDPIPAPYNEATPMTNKAKFPTAIDAVWSSGEPTIAPSGATFIVGSQWQALDGAMAVAVLKDKFVKIFTFDKDQKIIATIEILQQYGRVRSVVQGPDGALYLSTDNGQKQDIIVKVTPES